MELVYPLIQRGVRIRTGSRRDVGVVVTRGRGGARDQAAGLRGFLRTQLEKLTNDPVYRHRRQGFEGSFCGEGLRRRRV